MGVPTRAHYQPCMVAEAVTQAVLDEQARDGTVAKEHGCHRRTVLRWVERVALLAEPAQLMSLLLQESQAPVVPAVPSTVRPRRSAVLMAQGLRAVSAGLPPALHPAYTPLCTYTTVDAGRAACSPVRKARRSTIPTEKSPAVFPDAVLLSQVWGKNYAPLH